MARTAETAMFTRTVNGTTATIKAVNVETEKMQEMTITLASDKLTEQDIKRLFNKSNPDYIAVKVVKVETVSKMYGLSLADFMKYAVELDSETRKPLEK